MSREPCERGDEITDVILPVQFFGLAGDGRSEPERRLMAAVLEDALALLLRPAAAGATTAVREAQRWMASDGRGEPFGFATICDVLGLSSERVRAAVRALRARGHVYERPRNLAGRGRHRVQGARRRRAA